MDDLKGKIALVTGASRGAGKGIALELGKAGATVYVTGRSIAGKSTKNRPGNIDQTVEEIKSYGGLGIPVQCDHNDDKQVELLIGKIKEEQGKLDILVNNVWGGHEGEIEITPFWEQSLKQWDNMFTSGVRSQLVTNYYAVPFMLKTGGSLIIHTTYWDDYKYTGGFYYDLAKNTLTRMAYGLSCDLKKHGIAVIALSPGWMRTELVLDRYKTDEEHWKDVPELCRTESTSYVGRAVCALAKDGDVFNKTGKVFRVADLAREYGFTDIDGRQVPPFLI